MIDKGTVQEFLKNSLFNKKIKGTCAVVFSSHILLNTKYGNLIDSFDFVLRFNFAPTKNFELDVGEKVTHRILGGCKGQNYYFKEKSEMILRPIKNISNDKIYLENDYKNSKIQENHIFFSNYGVLPSIHCSSLQNPSNGFLGFNFAVNTFDKVGLFGFEDKKNSKYHYFDDQKNIEYIKNKMSIYDLENPYSKAVRTANSNHAFFSHPIEKEKEIIKKKIIKNDNICRY